MECRTSAGAPKAYGRRFDYVAPMTTHEPERTDPVALCLPNGHLNPVAVGWSRRPIQHCALPGRWGRRKRWDYWCITAEPLVVQFTMANLDLLRLGTVAVFDTVGGDVLEAVVARGPGDLEQPDEVEGGPARFEHGGLRIEAIPAPEGTRLRAEFTAAGKHVLVDAVVAPAEDTLNVVVPWSDTRYQFTSKHVGRSCRGSVTIDGVSRAFEGEAGFDYGRGRWPARTRWNWGAGAGLVDGRKVGLQVGAQWTDGTGMTENGVFLDGRLDKIGDTLRFEPGPEWRIWSPGSDRVDLQFAPARARPMWIPGLARLDLHFGHWRGVVKAHGQSLELDRLFGWTEEMRVVW